MHEEPSPERAVPARERTPVRDGDRSRSTPYIDLPPQAQRPSARPRSHRWKTAAGIVGLAALLALSAVGIRSALLRPAAPESATPVLAAREKNVLIVAAPDEVPGASTMAADILASRNAQAGSSGAGAPSPVVPTDIAQASDLANASAFEKALAGLPNPLLGNVSDGKSGVYALTLMDFLEEDGDVVELFVDGTSCGEVGLWNAGQTVTLPFKNSGSSTLRVLAKSDGGGGVTLGLISSRGEYVTRTLGVGEYYEWTVVREQ